MRPKPDLTLSAPEQRRRCPDFLTRCAIMALIGRLPLPWPTPSQTPPSPKRRYRSHYQPPHPPSLLGLDADGWTRLSLFDLLLRLVDFSGLRPVLAQLLYRPSARGRCPFDPVSLFLLWGWQLVNGWDRVETLRHLTEPRYSDYAAAFGFRPDLYPTESGLRYVLTRLGQHNLTVLLVQSMTLVAQTGVLPAEVRHDATVSFDGMLHDAASRLRCSAVQASCYTPTTPETPRPCPAKEKGQRGCACTGNACQVSCRHAPPRDPEARYVWYSGSNRTAHPNASVHTTATRPRHGESPLATGGSPSVLPRKDGTAPPKSPKGEGHYGYRSLPATLIDPVQRTTWILAAADLTAANGHEDEPAAALLRRVVADYPWLHVTTAVGDAGLGYGAFLGTAYELGVRRVVDLRADPRTDADTDGWSIRGYDDKGWPVCQLGYRLHPNGYDAERQRSKWCCRQSCKATTASIAPPDCPYRDRPLGLIKNVGKTFADGSLRLVRDVPYGSATWKEVYRRARNGAEGRNATLQGWALKRLPVFGHPRAQTTLFLADVWANLTTLARLLKEATLAQMTLEPVPV